MGEDIYLKNVRVIDVQNGKHYEGCGGVLIRNGDIAGLPGLAGEPEPSGCRTIDLKGRYVIPALFNTHCHLQLMSGVLGHAELKQRQIEKSMADCLEYGITNIRDAWAPDLSLGRALAESIKNGAIKGPRIQQCVAVCPPGNFCAPRPNMLTRMVLPLVDYSLPASGTVLLRPGASAQEARDAVDRAIDERGADCIKFYDQMEGFMSLKPNGAVLTDGQLAAAADRAYQRGIPATVHHTGAAFFRRDIACGVKSLAHISLDELLTDEDIAAFIDSGAHIEPTLSVSYGLGWSCVEESIREDPDVLAMERLRKDTFEELTRRFWLPELADIHIKGFDRYAAGRFKIMGVFDMSAPLRRQTKGTPVIAENLRRLYKAAKERFAAGNDATVCFYTQAAIQLEIMMFRIYLERGGIKPDAADLLRIATIQSARSMGLEKRFGTIEKGKAADIVLLDGDPLSDSALIGAKAAAVFKGGRLVVNNCGLV